MLQWRRGECWRRKEGGQNLREGLVGPWRSDMYLDVMGRKTVGVDPSPCADLETVCGLGSTR